MEFPWLACTDWLWIFYDHRNQSLCCNGSFSCLQTALLWRNFVLWNLIWWFVAQHTNLSFVKWPIVCWDWFSLFVNSGDVLMSCGIWGMDHYFLSLIFYLEIMSKRLLHICLIKVYTLISPKSLIKRLKQWILHALKRSACCWIFFPGVKNFRCWICSNSKSIPELLVVGESWSVFQTREAENSVAQKFPISKAWLWASWVFVSRLHLPMYIMSSLLAFIAFALIARKLPYMCLLPVRSWGLQEGGIVLHFYFFEVYGTFSVVPGACCCVLRGSSFVLCWWI